MSNVTHTGGLRVYKSDAPHAGLEKCVALSGDSAPLGIGDAVKVSAAGATSVSNGPVVMAVTRAAAGDALYGVMEGVETVLEGTGSVDFSTRYRKASTAQYIYVRRANHSDQYCIQDDGAQSMTAANIGNNANLVVSDCDTTFGMSKMYLGSASAASGNATRQLKIVGYKDRSDNDTSSTGAEWIVTLNNIYTAGGTGTVGV